MDWGLYFLKHTTFPSYKRLGPAQKIASDGRFFERAEKKRSKSVKITSFGLLKILSPHFLRSELKICAGPTGSFQYNPMTVPEAIRLVQRPPESRSQLKFVAMEVFWSLCGRFTTGFLCNFENFGNRVRDFVFLTENN